MISLLLDSYKTIIPSPALIIPPFITLRITQAYFHTSRHDAAQQHHKQYLKESQNKFPLEFILGFFPRILVLSKIFSHLPSRSYTYFARFSVFIGILSAYCFVYNSGIAAYMAAAFTSSLFQVFSLEA